MPNELSRKLPALAVAAAGAAALLASGAALAQDRAPDQGPDRPQDQTRDVSPYQDQGQPPLNQQPLTPQYQTPQYQTPQYQGYQSADTQTCRFTSGPRAGSTVDFSATPGVAAVPVGTRCGDMKGSTGVAVSQTGTGRQTGQTRQYRTPGAPQGMTPSGQVQPGYTLICRFNTGPRAGGTQDFTGQLGATPVRIGSACSDGSSQGRAMAPGRVSPG